MLKRQFSSLLFVLIARLHTRIGACPLECTSCVSGQCEDCGAGYQLYHPYPDGVPTCEVVNQTENVFGLKELELPETMVVDVPSGESAVIIDQSERRLDYDGKVTGWELNAFFDGTEPGIYKLKLQVWEPLSPPANMTYRLRGQSILDNSFFTTGDGIYRLDLTVHEQFEVKQGDTIGFACDNYQPIRYAADVDISTNGETQISTYTVPGPSLNVGDTFTFEDGYGAGFFYTYHALLKPKVCPECCLNCTINKDLANGHGDWICNDPFFYDKVSMMFGLKMIPTAPGSIFWSTTVGSSMIDTECAVLCMAHARCQTFYVEGTTCRLIEDSGSTTDVSSGRYFEPEPNSSCL